MLIRKFIVFFFVNWNLALRLHVKKVLAATPEKIPDKEESRKNNTKKKKRRKNSIEEEKKKKKLEQQMINKRTELQKTEQVCLEQIVE